MSNDDTPSLSAESLPPLALIAGPTASGKSDHAVNLALELKRRGREAVIINADSAQVYADLRILSARPSDAEMQGIPHRLFGQWDGATPCSAADWAVRAKAEIARAHGAGHIPILVGGTGLYVRTLLDGIAPVPAIDSDIRAKIRALPLTDAYACLKAEDPQAAQRLHPNDTSRIARALEVVRATGRPLSAWQSVRHGGIGDAVCLHPLILLPERAWLYERCDRRFAQMLEQGAVEEVEALLRRQLDPALPVMRAIGVEPIAGWLREEWDKDYALQAGMQTTRNYAKRQYTWFRRQSPESWPRATQVNPNTASYFEILLQ